MIQALYLHACLCAIASKSLLNQPSITGLLADVAFTVAKRKEFLTCNRFKLTSVIRKICKPEEGWYGKPKYCSKKAGREEQIKLSILVLIIVS